MSRRVAVQLSASPQRQYEIYIGPSVVDDCWRFLALNAAQSAILIVADANVARLHLAASLAGAPEQPQVVTLEPGEATKSLASASRLYDALAAMKFERSD